MERNVREFARVRSRDRTGNPETSSGASFETHSSQYQAPPSFRSGRPDLPQINSDISAPPQVDSQSSTSLSQDNTTITTTVTAKINSATVGRRQKSNSTWGSSIQSQNDDDDSLLDQLDPVDSNSLHSQEDLSDQEEEEEIQGQQFLDRLRSFADYAEFAPEAMTTHPLTGMIAISSHSHGILLLPVSAPYQPLKRLHHASIAPTSSLKSNVQTTQKAKTHHLEFSPSGRYLAVAHHSRILIWDTHNDFAPLPLSHPHGTVITDLDWTWSESILWASTWKGLVQWEVKPSEWRPRMKPKGYILTPLAGANEKSSPQKHPTSSDSNDVNPIMGIACHAQSHLVACIDLCGIVRIYDEREIGNAVGSEDLIVDTFRAHGKGGLKIETFIQTSELEQQKAKVCNSNSKEEVTNVACTNKKNAIGWLTAGFDNGNSPNEVSINLWSREIQIKKSATDESYWYMGGGESQSRKEEAMQKTTSYTRKFRFSVENYISFCLCPAPFSNMFVTVSNTPMNYMTQKQYSPNDIEGFWTTQILAIPELNHDQNQSNIEIKPEVLVSFRSGGPKDKTITKMVGRNFNSGKMLAAHLAFGPAPSVLSGSVYQKTRLVGGELNDIKNRELLLFTLGSTGYVATHSLPEVTERKKVQNRGNIVAPTSMQLDESIQFFNDRISSKGYDGYIYSNISEVDPKAEPKVRELTTNTAQISLDLSASEHTRASYAVFDFDDEHITEQIISTPAKPLSEADEESMTLDDDDDKANLGDAYLVPKEKAKKMPCPKLCGASFGPRGELIVFHNGPVKRMWSWSQNFAAPQSARFNPTLKLVAEDSGDEVDKDWMHFDEIKYDTERKFPRNLFELIHMQERAKKAQWGDTNDKSIDDMEDNDDDSENLEDDFEGSLGDLEDSDDFDDEEVAIMKNNQESHDLRDLYFGATVEGMDEHGGTMSSTQLETSTSIHTVATTGRSRSDSFVRSTIDNLSPVVFLTNNYEGSILSGQCLEFADKWLLGSWAPQSTPENSLWKVNSLHSMSLVQTSQHSASLRSSMAYSADSLTDLGGWAWKEETQPQTSTFGMYPGTSTTHAVLSYPICLSHILFVCVHFSFLFPKASQEEKVDSPSRFRQVLTRAASLVGNMNKIYASDKESFLPYPDQEIMQKVQNDTSSNGDETSISMYEGGIHPIESSNDMVLSDSSKQRLIQTSLLCAHNAHIANSVGQKDKANVWMLLSETAENVASNANDAFDGWHGLGDGAIGRDIIENILKFYEAQGDV